MKPRLNVTATIKQLILVLLAWGMMPVPQALALLTDHVSWQTGPLYGTATMTCTGNGYFLSCTYSTSGGFFSDTASGEVNVSYSNVYESITSVLIQDAPTTTVCARFTTVPHLCWRITQNSHRLDFTGLGSLADTDNDFVMNNFDANDDNDARLDGVDNCPLVANNDQLNTDGDSQGDACDTDDDNDGALDINDAFPLNATESVDTDSDGIGNNADWDDDGDGVPDTVDLAPLNAADTTEIILPLDGTYKGFQLKGAQNANP